MARIIPNQTTRVYFATTLANYQAPTTTEITASVELTSFIISINATTRGNIVQTPSFDNRFETNIPGTVTSTFESDMYRDTAADTAWTTLPRDTTGYFLIFRFGGTTPITFAPKTGDKCEVWPVRVTTRAAQNLTSNTAQTFMVQCSVPQVPAESATVA